MPQFDWRNRSVVVTGGAGFLGSHVVDRLVSLGASVHVPRSADVDLRDAGACREWFEDRRPEVVIHCAVDGGGIGYMRANPATVFHNNILLNTAVLHAAWEVGATRFVGVSSVCAYPRDAPVPMREDAVWDGLPEPTNGPYGQSKRLLMAMGAAYHAQYGFRAVFPMPVNLYGPRDAFEPERSHVVPALIRRFLEAKAANASEVTAWGTGTVTRELLYVEDCAEAIVLSAERLDDPAPINLGTGIELRVSEIAQTIADAVGYDGDILWDVSKPDGQPRKCLDVSRARDRLQWAASTSLAEGLARTVDWYLSHREVV